MASILLIEDEPSIAGIILFKLRREGHEVLWEADTAQAEGAVDGFRPDLVLLEASLAGAGLALLERLQQRCRVAVLTELHDEETPARALRAGAAAAIPKPFKPTVLARTVGQLTA
jgi:two-component system phosphate regulon response regulator PhoB